MDLPNEYLRDSEALQASACDLIDAFVSEMECEDALAALVNIQIALKARLAARSKY